MNRPRCGSEDERREFSRKRLLDLNIRRQIAEAAGAGLTPASIAKAFNLPLPEVRRIAKGAAAFPEALERTPVEVTWDRAVGTLTDEQMLDELLNWAYTFTEFEPGDYPGDGVRSGSWDEVITAHNLGLLTIEEVETLAEKVKPPF